MGINPDGLAALITTAGNPDSHVMLRGPDSGPNHDAHLSASLTLLGAVAQWLPA